MNNIEKYDEFLKNLAKDWSISDPYAFRYKNIGERGSLMLGFKAKFDKHENIVVNVILGSSNPNAFSFYSKVRNVQANPERAEQYFVSSVEFRGLYNKSQSDAIVAQIRKFLKEHYNEKIGFIKRKTA